MELPQDHLARDNGHADGQRNVERERRVLRDEAPGAGSNDERERRASHGGTNASERLPLDVGVTRHEERGEEVPIEPLLVCNHCPRDQNRSDQRKRELDRDAERQAHGTATPWPRFRAGCRKWR
jgi:hypothetical protein